LHYTQANKIIKSTFDVELLQKWLANETRSAVTKAIDAQLKLLELGPVTDDNNAKFL
jgi:hypothetical protein